MDDLEVLMYDEDITGGYTVEMWINTDDSDEERLRHEAEVFPRTIFFFAQVLPLEEEEPQLWIYDAKCDLNTLGGENPWRSVWGTDKEFVAKLASTQLSHFIYFFATESEMAS